MFTKPESYYDGYEAYKKGALRTQNPFTWAGVKNRGNETWWFTGFDDADKENKYSTIGRKVSVQISD